jgi:nucleoside-diphosphate-sugar epimerase
VLRYGGLYGPGTSLASDGEHLALLRRGRFPIVGGATGVWSFVHVEDAAESTIAAIERVRRGVYDVVAGRGMAAGRRPGRRGAAAAARPSLGREDRRRGRPDTAHDRSARGIEREGSP